MAEFGSLRDLVSDLIPDGSSVAMEGFTHLIPFAAGHELIRQGKSGLTLIRMTPDVIYDQMIGAGCASALVFSWGGNPGVGSLHRFRDAVAPVFSELYQRVVNGDETRIVLEKNSDPDYREKLDEELKAMRESEMWQTGAAVRSLRPENWKK